YFACLVTILAAGVKSRNLSWGGTGIAIFILGWAVLILTAQCLSLLSAINVTGAYVTVSLALAAMTAFGLHLIAPQRALTFPDFPLTLS
ncbi:hypothetical protein NL529_29505, partial [Klebsiella pneumoniae]|nr:hypothetical protein [Klebsiella pneumoniae]